MCRREFRNERDEEIRFIGIWKWDGEKTAVRKSEEKTVEKLRGEERRGEERRRVKKRGEISIVKRREEMRRKGKRVYW